MQSQVSSARRSLWRSRWAAIGAAVTVSLGGGALFASASATNPTEFVAITPCRLLDTRPSQPVSGGAPRVVVAHGAHGSCEMGIGLRADGRELPRGDYSQLLDVIGTKFGGGDTTFKLPDLRSVTPDNMTYEICYEGFYPSGK